jgi:hypothetical protein
MTQDSPLSITASVVGILTFVAAVVFGIYAHALWLRQEFQRLIAVDDEILRTLQKFYQSLEETLLVDEILQELENYNSNRNLERTLTQMYILHIRNTYSLEKFLGETLMEKRKRWAKEQNNIWKNLSKVESLRSRLFYIQLSYLSRLVSHHAHRVG